MNLTRWLLSIKVLIIELFTYYVSSERIKLAALCVLGCGCMGENKSPTRSHIRFRTQSRIEVWGLPGQVQICLSFDLTLLNKKHSRRSWIILRVGQGVYHFTRIFKDRSYICSAGLNMCSNKHSSKTVIDHYDRKSQQS